MTREELNSIITLARREDAEEIQRVREIVFTTMDKLVKALDLSREEPISISPSVLVSPELSRIACSSLEFAAVYFIGAANNPEERRGWLELYWKWRDRKEAILTLYHLHGK